MIMCGNIYIYIYIFARVCEYVCMYMGVCTCMCVCVGEVAHTSTEEGSDFSGAKDIDLSMCWELNSSSLQKNYAVKPSLYPNNRIFSRLLLVWQCEESDHIVFEHH